MRSSTRILICTRILNSKSSVSSMYKIKIKSQYPVDILDVLFHHWCCYLSSTDVSEAWLSGISNRCVPQRLCKLKNMYPHFKTGSYTKILTLLYNVNDSISVGPIQLFFLEAQYYISQWLSHHKKESSWLHGVNVSICLIYYTVQVFFLPETVFLLFFFGIIFGPGTGSRERMDLWLESQWRENLLSQHFISVSGTFDTVHGTLEQI